VGLCLHAAHAVRARAGREACAVGVCTYVLPAAQACLDFRNLVHTSLNGGRGWVLVPAVVAILHAMISLCLHCLVAPGACWALSNFGCLLLRSEINSCICTDSPFFMDAEPNVLLLRLSDVFVHLCFASSLYRSSSSVVCMVKRSPLFLIRMCMPALIRQCSWR